MPKPTKICDGVCQDGSDVCPDKCQALEDTRDVIRSAIHATMTKEFGPGYAAQVQVAHQRNYDQPVAPLHWRNLDGWVHEDVDNMLAYLFGEENPDA